MSRKAMKLAQKAIEAHNSGDWDTASELFDEALPALCEALAEQPAQQEPVAWKLVPATPTEEMLKAMDECSKEGYDERLYAGHAASVYMAAVDAAPTPPAQRKPLTVEKILHLVDTYVGAPSMAYPLDSSDWINFARAIEAAHNIKENT